MPRVHPAVLRAGDPATIQTAEALVKALTIPDWGTKKFQAGNLTRKLESGLSPYGSIPEVRQVLDAIKNKQPLDSRLIHYVKRRFLEREAIGAPTDLVGRRTSFDRFSFPRSSVGMLTSRSSGPNSQ
ncbi:MAG: hypothetical protein P9F19_04615 [Candidatus Contendobacter sp.]|nr:hypothetical protein [Candidatus Contendobacter sp.]MDG4556662.1 hypothetical protein [Candidatus Contendobacter sp.]